MAAERVTPSICFPTAALVLIVFLLFPSICFSSSGRVDALSGAAYLKHGPARWAVLSPGQEIDRGDSIKTGPDGRVSIVLEDGTRLSIGNDTELEITEFTLKKDSRNAVYSLSSGKLRAVVGKFSGKSSIKVKTPTGIAGVKGTDFIIMNQGDANVLFGMEDTVSVSGGRTDGVSLGPDMMTENTKGVAPIEPVKVEPGSSLEEARAGLEAVTDVNTPVQWEKTVALPMILARWNINYSHYLSDSARYKRALDILQIAIDLTDSKEIRAEAHLERGAIYSLNLNDPKSAIREYMTVIDKYPERQALEQALFSAGLIRMELGQKNAALALFRRYRDEFPDGSHRDSVDMLIQVLERSDEAPQH